MGKVLAAQNARVAYLTSQPIEEKRADPDQDVRNQSLRKFSDGLKDVATKANALFVDQFDPYMKIMLEARATNPSALIGGGDAVHPGPIGHTVMAWAVLKGLGASALVSQAEIDAAAGKVATTDHCRVQNVKVANGGITFDRIDEALPMPIDSNAEAALKLAPILGDLSQYLLRVTGLAPGQYEVRIDDDVVAKVSQDDLAKGWNLAANAGPITTQARQVLKLVFEKNNVFFNRWRNVQLFDLPGWARGPEIEARRATELARIDQQVADLESQINAARQPKSHHFEVKPIVK